MYVCTLVKWVADGTPLPAGCTARRGARCAGANILNSQLTLVSFPRDDEWCVVLHEIPLAFDIFD